ncbi:hypothetical protein ACFXO7_18055, partial [Nocardia tengchongensis]|uniref:DUF7691 family protein n=1 Tax=Nocardia tengchongensis TaxID=2055889 RepID=UPI0036877809
PGGPWGVKCAVVWGWELVWRPRGGPHADEFGLVDEEPTLAQALHFVIMGTTDADDVEERAAEAYEHICETLCVAEWGNGPYGSDWLERSSRGFEQLKIDAINFEQFEFPNSATPWNELMGDAYYGEWSHEDCVRAVAQWESATAKQRSALEPDDLWVVESAIGLAKVAARSPAYGVAGFFHT